MNPSYIANNPEELLAQAPVAIRELLLNGEVERVTNEIGTKYTILPGEYIGLSNIISFALIKALDPENLQKALMEIVGMPENIAESITTDLQNGILKKVTTPVTPVATTVPTTNKAEPVVKLAFASDTNTEELRKKLLDTTKRESGITKNQAQPVPGEKPSLVAPGSRNQLMEQLQVLSSIPNDEEIESRLKHIQEQIASIVANEEKAEPDVKKIPAKVYSFGEKGGELVEAKKQMASYSSAPTRYNVDPYREIAED